MKTSRFWNNLQIYWFFIIWNPIFSSPVYARPGFSKNIAVRSHAYLYEDLFEGQEHKTFSKNKVDSTLWTVWKLYASTLIPDTSMWEFLMWMVHMNLVILKCAVSNGNFSPLCIISANLSMISSKLFPCLNWFTVSSSLLHPVSMLQLFHCFLSLSCTSEYKSCSIHRQLNKHA